MAAPVVEPTTVELYAAVESITAPDEELDWPLLRFLASVGDQLWETERLNRDDPAGHPGWSALLDLDRIDDEWLAYVAQFIGVRLIAGTTPEQQLVRIAEAAGMQRGRPSAIRGAAKQFLTGTKTVQLFERYQGDAYRLRLRTFAPETPDADAVEAAVRALKPAGITLLYDVSTGQTYQELLVGEGNHSGTGGNRTYADVKASYATYADVKFGIPPEV